MIFLGLGSNVGDKLDNLRTSIVQMQDHAIELVRCSSVYKTPPWGIENQDFFLNAVCEVRFAEGPFELLRRLLMIEEKLGRVREQKWGPRILDLDILEFHRLQIHTETLTLPHPYYPKRAFVLFPFAELEPHWLPTGMNQSISELLIPHKDIDIEQIQEPLFKPEEP